MVRIRLRRMGAKNNPTYRVVVADQNSPRDGAFIETIGHYLPTRQPAVVEIDVDKARKWLLQGAQPSETAASLLKQKGVLDKKGKLKKLPGETTSTPETVTTLEPAVTPKPAATRKPAATPEAVATPEHVAAPEAVAIEEVVAP